MKYKVNKNDFFDRVAEHGQVDVDTVRVVYESIVHELTNIVCEGRNLSLTGFGTFSLKMHQGHPVQFKAKTKNVEAYPVLKFTASDVLMAKIRRGNKDGDDNETSEDKTDTVV